MARIIGAVASTHVPAIGKAIAEKKQNDPYGSRSFKALIMSMPGLRARSPMWR